MLKRRPKLRAEIIKTGSEQRSVCVCVQEEGERKEEDGGREREK